MSRKKAPRGTSYAFKYATADVVVDGKRLTVYGQHISPLDTKFAIFKEVLEYVQDTLAIDVLLIDREFFTVEIMRHLIGNGEGTKVNYIIPATKNKKICAEAEERFHRGEYVFDYPFGGEKGVTIKLFTMPNKEFDESKTVSKENPEFFVFSTNLPINIADTSAKNRRYMNPKRYEGFTRDELCNMYRSRWGIETDYRVYTQEFRPITTSNWFPIRYLYFFSGVIFRNIWLLCQQMYSEEVDRYLGKAKLRARVWKEIVRRAFDHRAVLRTIRNVMGGLLDSLRLMDVAISLSTVPRG